MAATMSDKVKSRLAAISFNPTQNASSKLTLVLCPAMTIERLTTGDFIGFSCLDAVLVELAAEFGPFRLSQRTGSLRHPVGNSCRGGVFLFAPTFGPFPGSAEIEDLSHARPHHPRTQGARRSHQVTL